MIKYEKFVEKKKKKTYLYFFNIMMKNFAFHDKHTSLTYLIVYLQIYFQN